MRYSEDHKQRVGSRIIAAAAAVLREHGLDGISIPALMKKVGLTHGSFYCHFRDRDELVAEAVRFAAEETAARVLASPGGDVRTMLARYLSREHRDRPAGGCVLAALGTEGRHQSAAVRRAFGYAARGLLRLVQMQLHPQGAAESLSDDALRLGSAMVGGMILARLVDDEELSARILRAAQRT